MLVSKPAKNKKQYAFWHNSSLLFKYYHISFSYNSQYPSIFFMQLRK